MEKIEFSGSNIFLATFKTNRDSFRVEIEAGIESYDVLKEIPKLPKGLYKITIEPELTED